MNHKQTAKICLLVILVLQFAVSSTWAAEDLYSGEVIVGSQGVEDRNEAIPAALIRVLQKLSGQRELPVSPAFEDALANAERLLYSFHYRNNDRVGANGDVTRELRLIARFMPAEVDALVLLIGLPRWQHLRPAIQIWVVIDDGLNRRLKPLEYQYAWEAMEGVAGMRGLPITWPSLDDEELQLIDMRLVWGGYADYLIEKGAPADGVLIVAARREGPRWVLRWNLANDGHTWSWRNVDQELMFALVEGVHRVVNQVAALNSIASEDQGQWVITMVVDDLHSASDYTRCLVYLQSQSLVTDVEILGAEPGRVHFRLQLNAAPTYVAQALNRDSVLLSVGAENMFEYRFLQ